MEVFRQKGVLRACFVRGVKCGLQQAGSILEYLPAAGGLDFGDVSSEGGPQQAGSILEYGPAAGGLDL